MFKLGYTATSEGQRYSGQNIFAPGQRYIRPNNADSKPTAASNYELYRLNSVIFLNRVGNLVSTFSPRFTTLYMNGWTRFPWRIPGTAFGNIANGNLFTIPYVQAGTYPLGQFELFRQFIRENIRQIWTTALFNQTAPNTFTPVNRYVNPVDSTPQPGTNYGVSTAANLLIDAYPAPNDPYPDEYDYKFWYDTTAQTWRGNAFGPMVNGNNLGLPWAVQTQTDNANVNNLPRTIRTTTDANNNTVPRGVTGIRVYSIDILRQRRLTPFFFQNDTILVSNPAPVQLPIPFNSYEIGTSVVIDDTNRGIYNGVNFLFELRAFGLQRGECIGNALGGPGRSFVRATSDRTTGASNTNRRLIDFILPSAAAWRPARGEFFNYPLATIHGNNLTNAPAHEFGHVMGLDDRYTGLLYAKQHRGTSPGHLGGDNDNFSYPKNNLPLNHLRAYINNPGGPGLLSTATYDNWRNNNYHTVTGSSVHYPMYLPGFCTTIEEVNTDPRTSLPVQPAANRLLHESPFNNANPIAYPANYRQVPYDVEYTTYFGWYHNIMSKANLPVNIVTMGGGGAGALHPRNVFGRAGNNESNTYFYLMYNTMPGGGAAVGYSDVASNQNITTIFITQVQLDIILNLNPATGAPMRLNLSNQGQSINGTPNLNATGQIIDNIQDPYADREERDPSTSVSSRAIYTPDANGNASLYNIDHTIGQYAKTHAIPLLFGPRMFWRWAHFVNLRLISNQGGTSVNPARVLNDFDTAIDITSTSSFVGMCYQDQGNQPGYWPVADNNYRQLKSANTINVGVEDVMDFRMSYPVPNPNGIQWRYPKGNPTYTTNNNPTYNSNANNNITLANLIGTGARAYKPYDNRYSNNHRAMQNAELGDALPLLEAIANYLRAIGNNAYNSTFQAFIGQGSNLLQRPYFVADALTVLNSNVPTNGGVKAANRLVRQSINAGYYKWDYSKPRAWNSVTDSRRRYNLTNPQFYDYYLTTDSNGTGWLNTIPLEGISIDEAVAARDQGNNYNQDSEVDFIKGNDDFARSLWNSVDHFRANVQNGITTSNSLLNDYGGFNIPPNVPTSFISAASVNVVGNADWNAMNVFNIQNLPVFAGLLAQFNLRWNYTETIQNIVNGPAGVRDTINGILLWNFISTRDFPIGNNTPDRKQGYRLRISPTAIYPPGHVLAGNPVFPGLVNNGIPDQVFDIVLRFYRNRRLMVNSL
jgi:hypothetical protein